MEKRVVPGWTGLEKGNRKFFIRKEYQEASKGKFYKRVMKSISSGVCSNDKKNNNNEIK